MAYVKLSIPRPGDGAGCAATRKSLIIIIDVEDVASEPTREVGNCNVTGNVTLKTGAKAISIYATASTIQLTEELSGDPDAEGIKTGLVFEHPGNSVAIKNFLEVFKNRGVIAIVQECDGSAAGRPQILGRVCNPLRLSLETKMDGEATKRTLTWKQALPDKFLAGEYSGEMPEIAEDASTAVGGA